MYNMMPIMLKYVNDAKKKENILTCQEWLAVSKWWVYEWSWFSLCSSVSPCFSSLANNMYKFYHQKSVWWFLFFDHTLIVGRSTLASNLDALRRVEDAIPLGPGDSPSRHGSSVENVCKDLHGGSICDAAQLEALRCPRLPNEHTAVYTLNGICIAVEHGKLEFMYLQG